LLNEQLPASPAHRLEVFDCIYSSWGRYVSHLNWHFMHSFVGGPLCFYRWICYTDAFAPTQLQDMNMLTNHIARKLAFMFI
jgi:hypothetical protein